MVSPKPFSRWCAALAAGLSGLFALPTLATSFDEVKRAIIESRWSDAERHAQALDARDPLGDFLGIYVDAARLAQVGRCEESGSMARTLLSARPHFAPAQELIVLCSMREGDQAAARAELAALLTILPEGPQRTVLEQMLASRDARDRPRVSAHLEVRPSTNVNRQTDATHLGDWTILPSSRGQQGTEIKAGVAVTQLLHATPDFELSGVLRADLSWNSVGELLRPELTVETPMRFGSLQRAVFTATPFVTLGFSEAEHALTRGGLRGAATARLADNLTGGWSGALSRSDHPGAGWRNSWDLENVLTLSTLFDERTRLTASVGLANHLNDDDERRFRTLWASLRLDHMMEQGLILGLQGRVGQRAHASARAPTIGTHQQDKFYSGRVELSHRDMVLPLFGSAVRPVVFYEYTRQSSNNVFYDYASHDVGLVMRTAF